MAYTPHEWVNGETITAEKMNNIEEGIGVAMNSYDAEIKANTYDLKNAGSYTVLSGDFSTALQKLSNGDKLEVLLWACSEAYGRMLYQRAVADYAIVAETGNAIELFFTYYDWYSDGSSNVLLIWTASGITTEES